MIGYLRSAIELVLERSATELIEALFVALVLALAATGCYLLCRKKWGEGAMLLPIVALVFNFVGMLVAAGYVRETEIGAARPAAGPSMVVPLASPDAVANGVIEGMSMRILVGADTDHNGFLSPDEAAAAAERFVKAIDTEDGKAVDYRALSVALRRRIKPPAMYPEGPAGLGAHPASPSS